MFTRRIQLIANTTYSVSLPKSWIRKHNLKPKSEVQIQETANKSLLISTESKTKSNPTEIRLDFRSFTQNIEGVVMACYYKGYENITVYSDTAIDERYKIKLRRLVSYMSGAEISFEDEKTIAITNLLDKSKVDVRRSLYRIALVLESSIKSMVTGSIKDPEVIEQNETEVDRLSHLVTKICSLAMDDMKILTTSKINDVGSIPSFLVIVKKLENVGDSLVDIAETIRQKGNIGDDLELLVKIADELKGGMRNIISESGKMFSKIEEKELEKIESKIAMISDETVRTNVREIIDYMMDIEASLITISFNEKVLKEKAS